MEWEDRATHIDYIRTFKKPNSNNQTGYWIITEIISPMTAWSATVWRKTSHNRWIRLAPSTIPFEYERIESGNLSKSNDGTVWAAGNEEKRLNGMLKDYMEKYGFDRHPYIYWNKTISEL